MFACIRTPRAPDRAVAIARAFSPRLQRYGAGCVVCDVSGLGRLLGEPPGIGAELWRACGSDSREASVAIAATQIAARLLASANAALTVVEGNPAGALAPLPLAVLRSLIVPQAIVEAIEAIEQAYEDAFEVFERWGLRTLGDLASLPADALSARLGQTGVVLRAHAVGVDAGPLVPAVDVPRFFERMELEWPIDGLEPLAFVLARLLEPLSASLERADRGAAAIRLDLRLTDRTTHTRVLQLPAAMRDARVLRTLLTLDLESHPPPAAVDVVMVEIDPAPGRVLQYSLLERARPSVETLATLTARLAALVGEARTGAPRLRDSFHPDAFEMQRFVAPGRSALNDAPGRSALDDAPGRSALDDAPGRSALDDHDAWRGGLLPADSGAAVLRRFRPPIAVRVSVEHGRPVRVEIARRGMPSGHVEQCAGPWRSSGDWWAHAERRWDRDEWDVALSDGSICRLVRVRGSGVWFLEGVVD